MTEKQLPSYLIDIRRLSKIYNEGKDVYKRQVLCGRACLLLPLYCMILPCAILCYGILSSLSLYCIVLVAICFMSCCYALLWAAAYVKLFYAVLYCRLVLRYTAMCYCGLPLCVALLCAIPVSYTHLNVSSDIFLVPRSICPKKEVEMLHFSASSSCES